MIPEITQTILATLKENMKSIASSSILTDEPRTGKTKPSPSVLVTSPDFSVEEFTMSGSEPHRKEVLEEKFSGDGKSTEFKLDKKPLRPILSVEHPPGEEKRDRNDFSIDYPTAKIAFRDPPTKGKNNIIVRYYGVKGAAELRSIQLNLKYLIQINAEETSQCEEITIDILKALILAKETLENQGVPFKVLGGRKAGLDHESCSSQIECIAQTKLVVEMPAGAMEKIFIAKKEKETV